MALALLVGPLLAAEPKVLLEETFTSELSKDWFWGLGTWKAENGVLRGFESGARRHGPVKVRKLPLQDAIVSASSALKAMRPLPGSSSMARRSVDTLCIW